MSDTQLTPADAVPEAQIDVHLSAVAVRQAGMEGVWQSRAEAAARHLDPVARQRILTQATSARTRAQRVFWLRRAGDALVAATAASSACKPGCSACCNIGVSISEAEAAVIGKEIGRAPTNIPADLCDTTPSPSEGVEVIEAALVKFQAMAKRYYGTPCTFLVNHTCSIYESRPIACRQLVNMDVDDLLCRIVPGHEVLVPHLDTRPEKLAYFLALGPGSRFADLREWFPSGIEAANKPA